MKVSGDAFSQCYNGQAAVDADSILIVVTGATSDVRQQIVQIGTPAQLLGATGYFGAAIANARVAICNKSLIAMTRGTW